MYRELMKQDEETAVQGVEALCGKLQAKATDAARQAGDE